MTAQIGSDGAHVRQAQANSDLDRANSRDRLEEDYDIKLHRLLVNITYVWIAITIFYWVIDSAIKYSAPVSREILHEDLNGGTPELSAMGR